VKFPALTEAEGRLEAKQKELAEIFGQAGPDMDMTKVTVIAGDSKAKVDHIRGLNKEMDELGIKLEDLREVGKAAQRVHQSDEERERAAERGDGAKSAGGKREGGSKSIGEMFVESKGYSGRQGQNGPEVHLDVDLKALFDTTAAGTPETTRGPRIVDFVTRPIQFLDLIPQTTTGQTAVTYMEETTYVNNAAEIAEGGPYPESALGLEEKSSPVRKVGTWIPVTDETLEDEPRARSYINSRLPFMVRQRLEGQVLAGNGTAPNLRGLMSTTGIQTQAKGGDPVPDAVYKAMTKVRVIGQGIPNATAWHPNDWQEVRLLRTTDGIYIWGSPSEPGPARIWGLPAVEVQGLTEGTALVGDFANFSELAVRRGIDIQISNSHNDFFTTGKQAVRIDIRCAFVVYRPAAFATVTGV
jgi:HK97 family phage major capsid protein